MACWMYTAEIGVTRSSFRILFSAALHSLERLDSAPQCLDINPWVELSASLPRRIEGVQLPLCRLSSAENSRENSAATPCLLGVENCFDLEPRLNNLLIRSRVHACSMLIEEQRAELRGCFERYRALLHRHGSVKWDWSYRKMGWI